MPPPPPPGDCSFTPSELLSFLRLKIAGEPLPATTAAAHFHDADIYTADPALLTTPFDPAPVPGKQGESGPWFFFTHVRPKSSSDSRKSRQVAGGVGTWHSERAPRPVLDDEGSCAGHSQYFSYKLKIGKNCSERTEWYMVEFSDDQEADLECVHGGEPQLVLCKIYKAHTHSRSGNGSASRPSCSSSARKRKVVDEASAPVKAKRRLFDSPAPASAARSQEQVRSRMQSNLMCHPSLPAMSKGKIGDTSGCIALISKADGEAVTSLKIGDTSDFSRFWPEPETTFDWGYTTTGDALPTLENFSTTNVRDADGVFCGRDAWPSAFHTSNDTTAFECGMPSASVLPTLDNCSRTSVRDVGDVFCGRDAWPSAFHTSNDTTAFVCGMPSALVLPTLENCSRTNVRDVGDVFCGQDAWPSAFHTSNDTTAFVCGMPSAPLLPLPPGEVPWWCGSHDVCSC